MSWQSTASDALYTGSLSNLTPLRKDVFSIILGALLSNGFRCIRSGDGLSTHNTTGIGALTNANVTDTLNNDCNDGVTYAKIAGSTANAHAYAVLKTPAGATYQCEICIQLISSASNVSKFRVKVSRAGFSSGSPSATRVPSASDEKVLCGSGTDASPVGGGDLLSTDGTFKFNGRVDSDSATPRFWFAGWIAGTDTPVFEFSLDFLTGLMIDSPYPYAVAFDDGTLAKRMEGGASLDGEGYGVAVSIGASGVTKAAATAPAFDGGAFYFDSIGLNSSNSKEDLRPVTYVRPNLGAARGDVGDSTMIFWCATGHSFADHINVATVSSKEYVVFGKRAFAWETSGTTCVR